MLRIFSGLRTSVAKHFRVFYRTLYRTSYLYAGFALDTLPNQLPTGTFISSVIFNASGTAVVVNFLSIAHPKIPAKALRFNRWCSLSSSLSCCLLDPDDAPESLKSPTWCESLASDPPSCESSPPQRTYVSITAVLANNAIRDTRLLQHRYQHRPRNKCIHH